MRPGGAFRVVLNRESRLALHPDPFYRSVVEVNVRDLYMVGFLRSFRIHTKAMVLRGDLRLAGDQVLHRMVKPPVAMVHLKRRDIIRTCKQLVAKANTEHRLLVLNTSLKVSTAYSMEAGSPGPLDIKTPCGIKFLDRCVGGFGREYLHKSTPINHAFENVLFNTKIQHCDPQPGARVSNSIRLLWWR